MVTYKAFKYSYVFFFSLLFSITILTSCHFRNNKIESSKPAEIRLLKGKSYHIKTDTIFPSNVHFIVEDSVTIYIENSSQISILGQVSILGTTNCPVLIQTSVENKGTLLIDSKGQSKSTIRHAVFLNTNITAKQSYLEILQSRFECKMTKNKDAGAIITTENSDITIEQSYFNCKDSSLQQSAIQHLAGELNCFNTHIRGFAKAIILEKSEKSKLVGNTIEDCHSNALEINNCKHLQIYNNTIKGIDSTAISIQGKASENNDIFIKNNQIEQVNCGISIEEGRKIYLFQNTINHSKTGISIGENIGTNPNIQALNNVICASATTFRISPQTVVRKEHNLITAKLEDVVYTDFEYVLSDSSAKHKNPLLSNPILKINTYEKSIQLNHKIISKLAILEKDTIYSDFPIKIEYRGTNSLDFQKHSYSFKILNKNTSNIALLQLPSSRKWVLYGPYIDKSAIRNALVYSLGKAIGIASPDFRFVNLFINNRYEGLYLLLPKIDINGNDLGIEDFEHLTYQNNSPALIFRMDKTNKNRKGKEIYTSKYQDFIKYYTRYPSSKTLTTKDKKWLRNYINHFETSLVEFNRLNRIDLESFVDYAIITELTKNIDGYRNSQYFYKFKNNPSLFAGPLWDYNFSLGGFDWDHKNNSPQGFVKDFPKIYSQYFPKIWQHLFENPIFKKAFIKRWKELRQTKLSDNSIHFIINNLQKSTYSDLKFEYANKYINTSVTDEQKKVYSWIRERCKWLDKNISQY